MVPAREVSLFLAAVFLGLRFMLLYEVLRLLRRLIRHGRRVVDAQDVIFGIFCGFCAFVQAFHLDDGTVRWYFTAGIAAGMLLWQALPGRLINSVCKKRTHPVK